ncbi:RapZ C-terminal domain-containing protein [Lichenicoccus sp.]|uniref:RapZ C-terminal domain-containing protein n=1 Tax=Lichenicoccus sp. TaxID=2781899 RepID=UPI003D11D2E2
MAAHIAHCPAYRPFLDRIDDLLRMVSPRFVAEGKTYATVSSGCFGGRHSSVALVKALAAMGSGEDELRCRDCLHDVRYPLIVTHGDLSRAGGSA